ncbi:hypothetical protein [Schaalia sp. ZJ1691]|uniref:AMIN-like domain-containing (lipo)protein n=1 Tax=Schaalia sp. ZJ1691 TaxID=2709404 RepID=UPI0013EAFFE5|nr:hypothetical protein [Schaalia sp. ZJ1691]
MTAPQSDAADSSQSAHESPETKEESSLASPINGNAWGSSFTATEPTYVDGSQLVFHDMRVGEYTSFYRVVIEFSGEGTPGVRQSWSQQPVEQGRGRALPVAGTSWLDLNISGTSMPITPELEKQYYAGPRNVTVGPLDVREDGTFEDQTHVVIGMDSSRDFQIGFLSNPTRVVIDVKK